MIVVVRLPLCQSDHPDVSARLITSEKGSVIVLINTSGKPLTKVKLTLRGSSYQSAESLVFGKLQVKKEASDFVQELPLELTDIILATHFKIKN